ncbi:hypothetical protein DPMN_060281 [Dreissena polymorpha]|uniref:Uncharacterized protein n=2 Tax=Dreissena polymorpha TaxID=45954 RepID=A0A9D4C4Y0_DREPO|nr:hypothetical protein DPMN_060281 [Dreissena polymorpha]
MCSCLLRALEYFKAHLFNKISLVFFQTQKPMLKYSNNSIKPVQLFNHADLVSVRSNAEAARNAYSSLSNASANSTMPTPFRSTMKPPPSPQQLLKAATGTD